MQGNGSGGLLIDWGSCLRAWLMDESNAVADSIERPIPLGSIKDGGFAQVLEETCGAWLSAPRGLPIVLCGMVGARGMWREAAYVPCPLSLNEIVGRSEQVTIAGRPAHILPGASSLGPFGIDVLRGEEIQAIGAATLINTATATACIPGGGTKWIRMVNGYLVSFTTWITGELFRLLRYQSMLGQLADGDDYDRDTFRRGLDRGRSIPINRIAFSARAEALAGPLSATQVSSYLSGLLIGSEIGCALPDNQDLPLILVAKGLLQNLYQTAFGHFGVAVRLVDAIEAKRMGLSLAARALTRTTGLVSRP